MKPATCAPSLLLAAFGAAGTSCVVPVGPEFQDPEDNYPPYIIESAPPVGSSLTPVSGIPATVQVRVGDANVEDELYARWLFDYPPATADAAASPPVLEVILPRGADRGLLSLAPDCTQHKLAADVNPHRLMLAVSDGPFLSPGQSPSAPYDTAAPGGQVLRAVWIVNLDCSK